MYNIIEKLRILKNRDSTRRNYHTIWNQFNAFLIKLDRKPKRWEDRVTLFITYLTNKGRKSSTLHSYVSAIKCVLGGDGYTLNTDFIFLNSITRVCRVINDRVKARFPIHIILLEMLLFEVNRTYEKQPYLSCLFKAILAIGYYGMFHVGELGRSNHSIRACNIHMGQNKNKILVILFSSKTHDLASKPQKIKISERLCTPQIQKWRHFCPFTLLKDYLKL